MIEFECINVEQELEKKSDKNIKELESMINQVKEPSFSVSSSSENMKKFDRKKYGIRLFYQAA